MANSEDKGLFAVHTVKCIVDGKALTKSEQFITSYQKVKKIAHLAFFNNPVEVWIDEPASGLRVYQINKYGYTSDWYHKTDPFVDSAYDIYAKTNEPVEVFIYRRYEVRIKLAERGPESYFYFGEVYRTHPEDLSTFPKPLFCTDDLATPRNVRKVAECAIDRQKGTQLRGDDHIHG